MKKIVWDDQFSVGVKRMDSQHQRIIRMYNKLVDNFYASAGSETLSEVLQEMVEYASEHFRSEEKLLQEHGYPDFHQQKTDHMEFKRRAGEFCLLAEQHDGKVVQEVLTYLHDWWTDHILFKDKRYSSHFNEIREQ